jgi:hypothetical protein
MKKIPLFLLLVCVATAHASPYMPVLISLPSDEGQLLLALYAVTTTTPATQPYQQATYDFLTGDNVTFTMVNIYEAHPTPTGSCVSSYSPVGVAIGDTNDLYGYSQYCQQEQLVINAFYTLTAPAGSITIGGTVDGMPIVRTIQLGSVCGDAVCVSGEAAICDYDCKCANDNEQVYPNFGGCCSASSTHVVNQDDMSKLVCCPNGQIYSGGSCRAPPPPPCGNGFCGDAGENMATCPTDCKVPIGSCATGQRWDSVNGQCVYAYCGDPALPSNGVNTRCRDLTPSPMSGYYCSDGVVADADPTNGRCCPVGQVFNGISCVDTEECTSPTDPALYCGASALSLPGSTATFVSRATCIGTAGAGQKPAGLSACCVVPGGKFGQNPYYDWTDASGTNAGVSFY